MIFRYRVTDAQNCFFLQLSVRGSQYFKDFLTADHMSTAASRFSFFFLSEFLSASVRLF